MAETSQMVRSYLKNLGYKDEDVTYQAGANGQPGTVNLQGKNFMQGTPGADGYIRAGQSGLDSAMNQFKGNQVTSKRDSLYDTYESKMMQPTQPFTYDVNAIKNDPTYQAQLASFQKDADSSANQAINNLSRRGARISSSSNIAANAAQQNVTNYANNDLLPQMIAKKYQEYADQINQQNTQNTNILGLAGVYDEQEQQAYDRGRTSFDDTRYNQEAEVKAKEAQAKSIADQEKVVYDNNWEAAEQTGTLPNELADYYGLPRGTKTLDAAKVGISQQNANTSSRNADTSRMNAGTSAKNASTSRMNANLAQTKYTEILGKNEFSSQVISGVSEFDNPEDAQEWLNANGSEITKEIGFSKFLELQKAIPTFFGKDTSVADAKNDQAIRSKAIGMATQDSDYSRATAQGKEQIIQEYITLLRGG